MALKIYGLPGSTCTARVLATIFEKNVDDFVIEPVNLATGAHKKPEFLKMQVCVKLSHLLRVDIHTYVTLIDNDRSVCDLRILDCLLLLTSRKFCLFSVS